MSYGRTEVHSLDALEEVIRLAQAGLVMFDGWPLAGKSTARSEICKRVGAIGLELDNYVTRRQGEYVKAIWSVELMRALHNALSDSSLVVLDGVCMRQVLEAINVTACLSVYVQPISPS